MVISTLNITLETTEIDPNSFPTTEILNSVPSSTVISSLVPAVRTSTISNVQVASPKLPPSTIARYNEPEISLLVSPNKTVSNSEQSDKPNNSDTDSVQKNYVVNNKYYNKNNNHINNNNNDVELLNKNVNANIFRADEKNSSVTIDKINQENSLTTLTTISPMAITPKVTPTRPQSKSSDSVLENPNVPYIVTTHPLQQQNDNPEIFDETNDEGVALKRGVPINPVNRLLHQQEQLRRRREEEELIAQQNEFLRNSLRGSRKLKALQDNKAIAQQQHAVAMQMERVSGVENEAYLEDEEAEKINGYGEMIAALTRLQNILTKSGMPTLAGRVSAAHNILSGAGVAHALAARHAVLQRRRPRVANPVNANSLNLQKDIVEVLAQSNTASAIELGNLLTSHEMEGLLLAHDRVATLTDPSPSPSLAGAGSPDMSSVIPAPATLPKSASVRGTAVVPPVVPTPVAQRSAMPLPQNIIQGQLPYMKPLPVPLPGMPLRPESPPLSACFGTLNDQNDNIRIIQIEKSVEPLGATVLNQGEAVVIGRIVRGGAAEKSGLLHEGDEILEVNGQELRGKTVHEVCALLSSMQGTLTFLIVPANSPPPGGGPRDNAILHVRAHFDYDPEDDLYIPCRELGISFQKGDVLHVISREDPKWWQAYREGEEDQTLAGLIPSQMYQHQREAIKLESLAASRDRDGKSNKSATLLCALKGKKKKRKKASSEAGYPLYATTAPDETEPEEILTYEEVALYYPRATHKRPIVLIGPPNIGRHELRQRLMADSDRFAAAVPHTSRARREGEVPGVDYHFITRQDFEADILARRFVEHGEYEKAYYGTSLEAIRTVVASGKICVLNLHPQSLKLLRASDLKPYVVLVAPPSLEKLRQKKIRNGEPFKEEELKDIIATARDMEARWGHLFDMIIINNDTERAYHQLLAEINSLEREPQWVPASWVYNNRDES